MDKNQLVWLLRSMKQEVANRPSINGDSEYKNNKSLKEEDSAVISASVVDGNSASSAVKYSSEVMRAMNVPNEGQTNEDDLNVVLKILINCPQILRKNTEI